MIARAAALVALFLLGIPSAPLPLPRELHCALPALAGIGDGFIYYPTRYPIGDWHPERSGLSVEDRSFTASDGVQLHAWWVDRPEARATVLFLHGNGGNITNCAGMVKRLRDRLGVRVLLPDYRGYGRSEGRPSEAGLYRDAEAAYDEALRLGAEPARLIIFGHSLGTAVATELALRRPCAGVVLEAPFTSIRAMVGRAVPFLAPEDLVSERYDTLEKIPRLRVPLLVIHGTQDRTIPIAMGRAVFEAAPEPKRLYEVPGGGHVDGSLRGGDEYYKRLGDFLDRALSGRAEPALF